LWQHKIHHAINLLGWSGGVGRVVTFLLTEHVTFPSFGFERLPSKLILLVQKAGIFFK
jgi:hypothetical protein